MPDSMCACVPEFVLMSPVAPAYSFMLIRSCTMHPCGRRLRSRTPPSARSRVECIYCCEPIEPCARWVCFVCNVQAHKACEEIRRDSSTLRGCPQCRTTKLEVVFAQKLFPAFEGIMCYICHEVINEGELCDLCVGGRGLC